MAAPGGLQQKQKTDVRRRLPDWSAGEAGEEVGHPSEEDGLEDGKENQDSSDSQLEGDELDKLAAAILWQVRRFPDEEMGGFLLLAQSVGKN